MEGREVTSKLFPSFTNYTDAMYFGNEPSQKQPDYNEWVTKYGDGRISENGIVNAKFQINQKITIYIIGATLWIVDIRHSGKPDTWEYCNTDNMHLHSLNSPWYHELESERIEKILDTKIPNCKFWDMVQKRAKEIYKASTENK